MPLGLVNAANARDIGGVRVADGRWVRRGLLYRANALNRLTSDEVDRVASLRLACLIDLRHPIEIEQTGANRLPATPAGAGPRLVSLPLFDPDHEVFTQVTAVVSGQVDPASLGMDDHAGDAAMRAVYRWFVTSPAGCVVFGSALRTIASRADLPLLFHCTAGKDRTGWLTAVVLSLLGADRASIMDDYLRTNELAAAGRGQLLAVLATRGVDPAALAPLLEARPHYLTEAFDTVDREFGDLSAYARDALGIDAATVHALRVNLLHDEPDWSGEAAPAASH